MKPRLWRGFFYALLEMRRGVGRSGLLPDVTDVGYRRRRRIESGRKQVAVACLFYCNVWGAPLDLRRGGFDPTEQEREKVRS